MRPIVTDGVAWPVRLSISVGLLVIASLAKTVEPIEMPFGTWTPVEPMNHDGN